MNAIKINVPADAFHFWSAIEIYYRHPNSINKQILFSEDVLVAELQSSLTLTDCHNLVDKFFFKLVKECNINDSIKKVEFSDFNLIKVIDVKNAFFTLNKMCLLMRKLISSLNVNDDFEFFEFIFLDIHATKAYIFTKYVPKFQKENYNLVGKKNQDPFIILKFNFLQLAYCDQWLEISYDKSLNEKGVAWLQGSFICKFKKLMSGVDLHRKMSTSLVKLQTDYKIDIIQYYKLYKEMKLKYAKHFIKNWTENTDPKKFVYEDIGIATYLMMLWNGGNIPEKNSKKQNFVDLGCGNGLLVHILNSEGHSGIGIDIRKRKIWDIYPATTVLQVLDCAPVTINIDPKSIQGTTFQLSKTGDVTWKIPENAVPTPLFKCDTYEVVSKNPYSSYSVLRFGSYKGHIIDCTECYFSDLTIKAASNKEFRVHTCILKLIAPEIDWFSKPTPLSNLSEDVISAILHYLYAQCLPPGLEEGTVKSIISAASQMPRLDSLVSLCHFYIRNLTLKNKIFNLVADIHTCASQIIDYFTNKQFNSSFTNETSDPAKLCFAVKNSIREAAVAVSKLLIICDLYTTQKKELSIEEGHEIILYAKSRIPIFMNQLESFLQAVKTVFSNLLPSQRQELACYLVLEVETIFDTVSSILNKVKTVFEVMLAESEVEETNSHKVLENLEQYTDSMLHGKELNRLRNFILRISNILLHLHQKKENYELMTLGNKIQSVIKNLEQLVEELPIFVLRVEEFTCALDEKLQWSESQFCFKVGTSKVSEVLKKLIKHKGALQDLLTELCDLVQRDSFSQSLVILGLLEPSFATANSPLEIIQRDSSAAPKREPQMNSVCVPPPAHRSRLSEAAGELLKSGLDTDMIFEIVPSAESGGDDNEDVTPEALTESNPKEEIFKVAAHRVIVASRCDWFRRALLSGMQEDINRKIQVHNTSPYLFSLFLKYLYSGQMDCFALSVDQIFELLLLSDRYELDSLKQVCEYGLKPHLDADSAFYFYSMADRYNAKILKSFCEQFMAEHPEVLDNELFEELPDSLRSEIYDVVICGKFQLNLPPDKVFSDNSYNGEDIEEMITNLHINSNLSSPDSDYMPFSQDFPRLEAALEQLREVVGQEVTRSQLVQLILAADCDVNRALNFYFSSS